MKTLSIVGAAAMVAAGTLGALAESYDLVIYGATPAGISAAVQAKRSGLKAVLIEPSQRIGGLTTGGLGRTDIGSKEGFGGIAREFYRDVAAWYRDPKHWTRESREDFASRVKAVNDRRFVPDEDTMWCFEPSAALAILEGWEKRDALVIRRGKRLCRERGKVKVEKVGGGGERIVSFLTEDGTEYRGKVFIDATYEGDLMAAAGVSYTVGREDNAVYGETINGIQRNQGSHKLKPGVDPYVVKGDPKSGILPGVEAAADDPRPDGSGDRRVQAYCYRMCLTDDPDNRIPFAKPADYDERLYELLFRNVEQGDVTVHRNQGPMPNRKTDTNNDGGFSTDFIGQSWSWPEASYAEREQIARRHLHYQQGLMWTLANHPRIPADVRAEYAKWGTCRDEFAGERGDGWQNQLYVREARRMVGAYVMTEHNCRKHVKAPHPIAYASYTMDSHHCRRYIGKDGFVHNDGDVQDPTLYPRWIDGVEQPFIGFGRYGVDYGALVPKKGECANLLVPVCISASHIAYGSIRMEPVFFSFGQSAAVAASRAIRDGVAVQDVDYAKLRDDLAAAGQLLPPAPAARHLEKTVEIRSWGKIRAICEETAEGDATIRYVCATESVAKQLAAKRRADILSFGDAREQTHYGIERKGNEVVERYSRRCGILTNAVWEARMPPPRRCGILPHHNEDESYPHWLDCFDRYAAGVWLGGGGDGFDVPDDFEWLKKMDLAMCVAMPDEDAEFAPGAVDWTQYDWYEAMARKYARPYRLLTGVGRFPWSWSREPLPYVRPGDPRYVGLPAWYYPEVLTTGSMNAGVPGVPSDRYRFDFRRRLSQRFTPDDSYLMGYQACEELTCGTVNYLAMCAKTPGVIRIWREWMAAKGVTDPGPVPVPEDFLPHDAEHDIDLFGEWEISVDGEKSWTRDACNDPMLMMYSGSWHEKGAARYRDVILKRTFEIPAAADGAPGLCDLPAVGGGLRPPRYLHLASAAYKTVYGAVPDVWVNGVKCPALPGEFSRCFDLGTALKDGVNEIKINAHGTCLPGYVYLTAKPLVLYPDMSEDLNARWALAVDFASHLRIRSIENRIRAHRAVDPVRPFKMMAVKEGMDEALALCRKYGAYFHDTGGASAFWCPYTGARLAKAHGLPWSCEQGGPPGTVDRLRASVSLYLQYGNDAADLVFAVKHYRGVPEIRDWCEKNAELIHAIGKLRLPTPEIAILRSSRNQRLGFGADMFAHDVGRGLLQACGREFVYLEIPDLHERGFANRFRMIIDDGTRVMTEEDAQAIRRYVEAGGIFVALPETGRNTPERKNAEPLDRAFGLAAGEAGMPPLRRCGIQSYAAGEAGMPPLRRCGILPHQFGKGTFVRLPNYDLLKMKDVRGAFVASEGGAPGVCALSSVGADHREQPSDVRQPKSARIRSLGELLDSLGLKTGTEIWGDRIWGSRRESKNGLYDVYLVTRMELPGKDVPPTVRGRVGFNFPKAEHGWIASPWHDFAPMETLLFKVPRLDAGTAGLRWLEALAEIWHPVEAVDDSGECGGHGVAALSDAADGGSDVLVLDRGWTPTTPALFGTLGWQEATNVTFRTTVPLPDGWKNDTVELVFNCGFVMRGLAPTGCVRVNGRGVPGRSPFKNFRQGGAFAFDVTDLARRADGRLDLEVEINGAYGAYGSDGRPTVGGGLRPPRAERPNGICGTFALVRHPKASATVPLDGPWYACTEYGVRHPVKPGERAEHCYWETSFATPARRSRGERPTERIFLVSEGPIRGLMLNGHILNFPDHIRRFDATGLLKSDGTANLLRWLADDIHGFSAPKGGRLPLRTSKLSALRFETYEIRPLTGM